jgi:hypothetical protein
MYTAAIADKNAAKAALNDEACDYQNAAAVDLYNDATHYTAPNNMGSLNVYTP